MRNLSFGNCSNDNVFQYAESIDDLKDIGDNTLVVMGGNSPIVGVHYSCGHFEERNGKANKVLTSPEDYSNHSFGYTPPAQKKRSGQGNYRSSGVKLGNAYPLSHPDGYTSHTMEYRFEEPQQVQAFNILDTEEDVKEEEN